MTDQKPKRPFKRPPPPDRPVKGYATRIGGGIGPHWVDIAEDRGRAWVAYADAVACLAASLGEEAAINALLWRVRRGLTIISCKHLEYQNVIEPSETRSFPWPSQSAGIAGQINEALVGWAVGQFWFDWKAGAGEWFDILASPPTRVRMIGAQIDATTLPAGMVPSLPIGPLIDGIAIRTGGAGRTNTVNVALRIMEDRARRGALKPKLAHEVRALQEILQTHAAYGEVPVITDKALENGIRNKYWAGLNGIK